MQIAQHISSQKEFFASDFSQKRTGVYSFSFNGKEKDDEWDGVTGSKLDFGDRIYDSRIGRWLSVDKLSSGFPNQSTYSAFENNPIYYIDKDGNIIDPSELLKSGAHSESYKSIMKIYNSVDITRTLVSILENTDVVFHLWPQENKKKEIMKLTNGNFNIFSNSALIETSNPKIIIITLKENSLNNSQYYLEELYHGFQSLYEENFKTKLGALNREVEARLFVSLVYSDHPESAVSEFISNNVKTLQKYLDDPESLSKKEMSSLNEGMNKIASSLKQYGFSKKEIQNYKNSSIKEKTKSLRKFMSMKKVIDKQSETKKKK